MEFEDERQTRHRNFVVYLDNMERASRVGLVKSAEEEAAATSYSIPQVQLPKGALIMRSTYKPFTIKFK